MHRFLRMLSLLLLLSFVVALPVAAAPGPVEDIDALATDSTGVVSGYAFNDENGDGLPNDGSLTLCDVIVTLGGSGLPGQMVTPALDGSGYCDTVLAGPYSFEFAGLPEGTYHLSVSYPSAAGAPTVYAATLPTTVDVVIGNGQTSTSTNFAMSWAMTLFGFLWQDLNGDGSWYPGEPVIPNALVEVVKDANGDGQINAGEPVLGSGLTNGNGDYSVGSLPPGKHLLRSLLPGGASSSPKPAVIISGEFTGTSEQNLGALPGSLGGTVWNDMDGDGVIDAGEATLSGARVQLAGDSNYDGIADVQEFTTDVNGLYAFAGLALGEYVLTVGPLTVPAGWVPVDSTEPLPVNSGQNTVDLGFYDPLNVEAMRPSEWNRECKRAGRPAYTQDELNTLVASAEASSVVFSEMGGVCDILKHAGGGELGHALKHGAALQLNLASGRLLPLTHVYLGDLSSVTTVAGAAGEVENLILQGTKDGTKRAADIAEAVNAGKGVGYGQQGSGRLARATYNGKDVTSTLRSSGGTLDMQLDNPAILQKWSPGALPASTNIFRPQLQVKVQAFYEGGILEVLQVLPNGSELSLGQAVPTKWNKDVNTTFTFNVGWAGTVGGLVSTEFRLVVRDPDGDGGHIERAKVDEVELRFDY